MLGLKEKPGRRACRDHKVLPDLRELRVRRVRKGLKVFLVHKALLALKGNRAFLGPQVLQA